jgi:putative transposase
MRYIELNPVKANIVNHPSKCLWTSYHLNACGKPNMLISPHIEYQKLGNNLENQCIAYSALFDNEISEANLNEIRECTNKS